MTSWVPLGWISWNVDDIIALELYTNKMHILIILLQVILDNKDWTEVYKLVTTEKSLLQILQLYQMVKTISKHYSTNDIDFFFFWQFFMSIGQLLWQVLQEDRSMKPLGSR